MRKFHFRKIKRWLKKACYSIFGIDLGGINVYHRSYDIRELLSVENEVEGFNRYDMIVRLLAVENYYGKNDYGWDLYRKQQSTRKASDWQNAENRFRRLIKSYEDKGYDASSEITIDANLRLWDGSHRMALAFYYHQYQISCQVMPNINQVYYGINWYKDNGFTNDEILKIQNRYNKLVEETMPIEKSSKISK